MEEEREEIFNNFIVWVVSDSSNKYEKKSLWDLKK
jgi:hypothetical protein